MIQEEIKEVVLEIRQYLINTEFAPEPFTEPIDPDKLTLDFPNQIHQKYIDDGYVQLADNQELPELTKFGVEKLASVYQKELTLPRDGEVWKKVQC